MNMQTQLRTQVQQVHVPVFQFELICPLNQLCLHKCIHLYQCTHAQLCILIQAPKNSTSDARITCCYYITTDSFPTYILFLCITHFGNKTQIHTCHNFLPLIHFTPHSCVLNESTLIKPVYFSALIAVCPCSLTCSSCPWMS